MSSNEASDFALRRDMTQTIGLAALCDAIPAWSKEQLGCRDCPLCGSPGRKEYIRPDGLLVASCQSCGLWFVQTCPSEKELSAFYENYWSGYKQHIFTTADAAKFRTQATAIADCDIRLKRIKVLLRGVSGKRVFEAGCGLGHVLLAMQLAGANVIGQDISAEATRFLREALNLEIYCGPLKDVVGHVRPVDLVIMHDLLEHSLEPLALIQAARDLLIPGGLLSIWTPNGGIIKADEDRGPGPICLRLDLEHMQYFTPRCIQWLAAEKNWGIEHLECVGFPSLPKPSMHGPKGPLEKEEMRKPGRIVNILHRIEAKFRRLTRDTSKSERDGAYHLFAILRKP